MRTSSAADERSSRRALRPRRHSLSHTDHSNQPHTKRTAPAGKFVHELIRRRGQHRVLVPAPPPVGCRIRPAVLLRRLVGLRGRAAVCSVPPPARALTAYGSQRSRNQRRRNSLSMFSGSSCAPNRSAYDSSSQYLRDSSLVWAGVRTSHGRAVACLAGAPARATRPTATAANGRNHSQLLSTQRVRGCLFVSACACASMSIRTHA